MTNNNIPQWALSLTQPWAWAVVHAGKPVENRDWPRWSSGLKFRGPFAVHAAVGMTKAEYEATRKFLAQLNVKCPKPDEIERGGIIGTARVVDVVTVHTSPYFFGPYGLVLVEAKPVPFIPVIGMLGFFDWRKSPEGPPLRAALPWMTKWRAES